MKRVLCGAVLVVGLTGCSQGTDSPGPAAEADQGEFEPVLPVFTVDGVSYSTNPVECIESSRTGAWELRPIDALKSPSLHAYAGMYSALEKTDNPPPENMTVGGGGYGATSIPMFVWSTTDDNRKFQGSYVDVSRDQSGFRFSGELRPTPFRIDIDQPFRKVEVTVTCNGWREP